MHKYLHMTHSCILSNGQQGEGGTSLVAQRSSEDVSVKTAFDCHAQDSVNIVLIILWSQFLVSSPIVSVVVA